MPGEDASPAAVAKAVQGCRGYDRYQRATQAVSGRGPARALVVLIGKQAGDAEDQAGEPFVGAAGKLLDRALAQVQISRERGTESPGPRPARRGGPRVR